MSGSLSNVEQIEFDSYVKVKYQSGGFLLRDAVRIQSEVVGNQVEFRKMDQIMSVPTGYSAAVTPQDPGFQKVRCTLQKYTTPATVDEVQELTVNFDSKMELAVAVSKAMGRRSDQIIIDCLNAPLAVSETIPDGGTGMTYEKYLKVFEYFEDNAVPLEERFFAMSAQDLTNLMKEDQFVSTFYTENRILDRAKIREYLGVNVITIPKMKEGGLPVAGGIRSAFAWHKMAVGAGIGMNFRTEVNYIPKETSYLVNGVFSAGAVVVDNLGVFKIENVVTP